MINLEIIGKIKELIKDKTEIKQEIFDNVMDVFCSNVLEIERKGLESNDRLFEYFLYPHVLMKWYQNLNDFTALKMMRQEIEKRNFEWGILFHGKGIWLLNRDVITSKTFFASKKTVLKFLFANKTDLDYLDLLHKDYLTGYDKSIYFFRDMITYKNTSFPSDKSNRWDVYWSCNKSFFYYYCCAPLSLTYN